MKFKKLFLSLVLSIFALNVFAQGENPVSWSSKVENVKDNVYEIQLLGSIQGKWHIYDLGPYQDGPISTTIVISGGQGVKVVGKPYIKTKVHKYFDQMFNMEIGTCENGVVIAQKVEVSAATATEVKVTVEWQTCDDGSCLPPTDEELKIKLPAAKGGVTVAANASGTAATTNTVGAVADAAPVADANPVVADSTVQTEQLAAAQETASGETAAQAEEPVKKSLWGVILEAIAWGFVALLTPCVFPMVPMTVSFFLKNSGGTKAKGRMFASFYGFSIVALYTLPIAIIIMLTYFLGGDAVTADIFNWLATHWIPNILFFIIFIVFAASFFGAFEITMPSWMVNKTDAKSDKGGLVGVFFMALTLVLVSFSCTGPIVSSVLIKSTQGEIWEPIITMFAFSAAFALPFTVFAFAPSLLKDLPKSGGWLNSVKVVLGFIELALGLKFLSVADQVYQWGLLDREVYLAMWIVIFFLLGLYLLGKLRFAHDTPEDHLTVKRLFLSIAVFSFVMYMIPGMWGAPLKALSGYLPPVESIDFNLAKSNTVVVSGGDSGAAHGALPAKKYTEMGLKHIDGIPGFFDYHEALEYSAQVGKPVFIDYTGAACVNCREMESRVFSDPKIKNMLNNDFVFVSIYGDVKTEVAQADWVTLPNGKVLKGLGKINTNLIMGKYKVNAMPYYIIVDAQGNEVVEPRGYNLDQGAFVEFLNGALAAYKK
ncbi:MAG: cytochrome c biogenesis protein CcdA [Bacteroidales bacterium]